MKGESETTSKKESSIRSSGIKSLTKSAQVEEVEQEKPKQFTRTKDLTRSVDREEVQAPVMTPEPTQPAYKPAAKREKSETSSQKRAAYTSHKK